MILLADSGSTKTDWGLVENGKLVKRLRTSGMNPFQMSEEAIAEEIKNNLVPELPSTTLDEVHFYGAGCTKEKQPIVERALRANLTINGECEVASDMLGAARGICGHKPGIACILGTGSNSCSYDGKNLVKNVSPLGFILGDEGSGAVLGKLFINGLFKGNIPSAIKEEFLEATGQTLDDIIRRVYREPMANRYLASFSPFIHEHIDCMEVREIVVRNFVDFFRLNVDHYGRKDLAIGAVGSVAHYYSNELKEAAQLCGYRMGKIIKSPFEF